MGKRARPTLDRFWEKVSRANDPQGCWLWTGARSHNGYGFFKLIGDRQVKAHRWAYEQFVGPVPHGLWVLHHCDIRHCVNPEHLFLGTQKINIADMMAKGRGPDRQVNAVYLRKGQVTLAQHPERRARGAQIGRARLTATQVMAIRAAYAAGGVSQRGLAKQYNVSGHTIYSMLCRRTWRHVP